MTAAAVPRSHRAVVAGYTPFAIDTFVRRIDENHEARIRDNASNIRVRTIKLANSGGKLAAEMAVAREFDRAPGQERKGPDAKEKENDSVCKPCTRRLLSL